MKSVQAFAGIVFGIGILVSMPSQARVFVDVNIAPPEQRVEVVPERREGYAWAPGYWNWDGRQHVWVGGRWIHERHGQHWVADHWDQHGDHYHHEAGHWERG